MSYKIKRTLEAWGKILLVLAVVALVLFACVFRYKMCISHYEQMGHSFDSALYQCMDDMKSD